VPAGRIERSILFIRGHKVILDRDLSRMYGVSTGNLNKAVTRNHDRFPDDFMFSLSRKEFANLKFHTGTSSWGGTRKLPRAFTEQGVAMLSSVLRSRRAVRVNIEIMRAFVRLRQMLSAHAGLARRLDELEKKYDAQFRVVFDAIRELMAPPPVLCRAMKALRSAGSNKTRLPIRTAERSPARTCRSTVRSETRSATAVSCRSNNMGSASLIAYPAFFLSAPQSATPRIGVLRSRSDMFLNEIMGPILPGAVRQRPRRWPKNHPHTDLATFERKTTNLHPRRWP